MDSSYLQDRIYFGQGKAARYLGLMADAYRTTEPSYPLDKQNRFLRLPVWFSSINNSPTSTNVYGQPLWHGIFDASYTQPGDYIVIGTKVYFIAAQEPLLPALCVMTNHIVSISRPNLQTMAAANLYGGYTAGASTSLLSGFPACVLGDNKSGSSLANLPTDQALTFWNILLPAPKGTVISPGDLIADDFDRNAVITSSELTDLGWRITAKMATT